LRSKEQVFELILGGMVETGVRKQLFWIHFINKQTLFLKSFAIMPRGREKFLQSHFFLFSLLDHPITQRAMETAQGISARWTLLTG
jgi:hypothetical protein